MPEHQFRKTQTTNQPDENIGGAAEYVTTKTAPAHT